MKYLKQYQKFFEDGEGGGTAAANASIAGMGSVVAAQPSALPGVPGTSGSGDIGFGLGGVQTKTPISTFNGKKKKKKKGDPTEVSDLRDLNESTFDLATECVKMYHWLCEDKVDIKKLDDDIRQITNNEGWYSLDEETLNQLVDLLKNYKSAE
jgi:hypothetical protein